LRSLLTLLVALPRLKGQGHGEMVVS